VDEIEEFVQVCIKRSISPPLVSLGTPLRVLRGLAPSEAKLSSERISERDDRQGADSWERPIKARRSISEERF
jgi:hypothetical protein